MAELQFDCPTVSSGTTSSGLSLENHETIDSLVHNLAEDSFISIVRNPANLVTDVNVLTSEGGTLIRSTAITRNSSNLVTGIVENQHDGSGAIIQTITTSITRSGGKVVSLTTVET